MTGLVPCPRVFGAYTHLLIVHTFAFFFSLEAEPVTRVAPPVGRIALTLSFAKSLLYYGDTNSFSNQHFEKPVLLQ